MFGQNLQKRSTIENVNITIKFYIFKIYKLLLSFSTNLAQKGYFPTKKKNENDHLILHIQTDLDSKFQFQQF